MKHGTMGSMEEVDTVYLSQRIAKLESSLQLQTDVYMIERTSGRLVHLDVEDCSEELLRQKSYAIKNQLGHPKPPTRSFETQNIPVGRYFACPSLVLYGIRAAITGPFRAWYFAFQSP